MNPWNQLIHPVDPKLLYRGRVNDPRLGEWIIGDLQQKEAPYRIALLGCPDDTGVKRNRGREGAKLGPDSIRKHLFKMTLPMDAIWEDRFQLVDIGNIRVSDNIAKTHQTCEEVLAHLLKSFDCAISLGGGHDFAAPNFLGLARAKGGAPKDFGILNIDPHLDVRELEEDLPHSGTPFRAILDSQKILGRNLVQFGTQINRNSRTYYKYCQNAGVQILPFHTIKNPEVDFTKALKGLAQRCRTLFVTLDMDSCFQAEGISAPPIIGFSNNEVRQFGYQIGKTTKVSLLEIAEVAPNLDFNERTSRLAAEIIFAFLLGRSELLKPNKSAKKGKNSRIRK